MTLASRALTASTAGLFLMAAQPSMAVVFGSNNDGLGGFTQSFPDVGQSWTTNADNVQYRNENNGTLNSSFLGEYVLDRSPGKSYTMTGVMTLNDIDPDDNNRIGMYLFGDTAAVLNEDELGAISVLWNSDDGGPGQDAGPDDNLTLNIGIDFQNIVSEDRNQTNVPIAYDLVGTQLTWSTTFSFVGLNVDIEATLEQADGDTTTASLSVPAADYTGDYFGFVTRSRSRAYPADPPTDLAYESFSIVQNPDIPEPASIALLSAGGLFLARRRRA